MKDKAVAWRARHVRGIMATFAWLFTLPLTGIVIVEHGLAWGLFAGFVLAPPLAVIVGVLATDKVSRPLPINWQAEVFRRDPLPLSQVFPAAEEQAREKESVSV